MKKMYIIKYFSESASTFYWVETSLTENEVKAFILDLIESGDNSDTTMYEVVKKMCNLKVELT